MQSPALDSGTALDQKYAAYTTPRPDISAMVPISAGSILDVGCSNGALGRSLKSEQPAREIWGIEFDSKLATEASANLIKVIHADLNILDWSEALAGRSFDCIIFADVLEHLSQPEKCLDQARNHLTKGGCLVISLPNIRHLSALRSIFLQGQFPRRDRGIFDRTHLRWYTIADAHRMLADHGLRVASISLAMRWGDNGGGRLNRLLNRLPRAVRHWGPIREFLTYQICLRAEAA
jgi:methionine biosynthesis protein MetW